MNYTEKYNNYLYTFESYLNSVVANLNGNERLVSSMKYSLLNGGKRLRPVLMLATQEMLGGKIEDILPFALSLECIHTYSLIHDDLPAMDNDDFRRGKPSNHKVYGEDYAIISGDALLNYAYEHALSNCDNFKKVEALKFLAESSGYLGMVGGQAFDLEKEKNICEADLVRIATLKTAKLITVAVVLPSIIADKNIDNMKDFGTNLGIAFQFVDDVLDVEGDPKIVGKTLNKDLVENKLTAVSVYKKQVKQKIDELIEKCIKALDFIENSEFLKELAIKSKSRVK